MSGELAAHGPTRFINQPRIGGLAVQKLKDIAAVVAAFIDSIAAIANSQIGAAAGRVEAALGSALNVVVAFLAKFVGLGKVTDKVVAVVKKLQARVDKALDAALAWIAAKAKALWETLKAKLKGQKKDNAPDKPPEAGQPSDRPRISVSVSLGPQAHEVIFEPKGADDVGVKMASGVALPVADVFARAMNSIDNWRRYIGSIQDPVVKQAFAPLLARLNQFHAARVGAFAAMYKRYFPPGTPPKPLPPQKNRQAGIEVTALTRDVQAELVAVSTMVAALPAALGGLSPADFEKLAMAEGARIWNDAWVLKKAAIDAAIAGENLGGSAVAYRGSTRGGMRGDHKAKIRFDPADFDVDMYVVNAALFNELTDPNGRYRVRPNVPGMLRPGESMYGPLRSLSSRMSTKIDAVGTGRPGAPYVVLRRTAP
jgi:hypothetical protein